MKLRNVVNIIADVSPVNFGVWNAATVGHSFLKQNNVDSFLWVTSGKVSDSIPVVIETVSIQDHSDAALTELLKQKNFTKDNTIIATHGSWLKPTRIGYALARLGYPWVYVPHGMLEPWSFSQKRLKKKIYYSFFERRFIRKAKAIRAVSSIEQNNLRQILSRNIHVISNGVPVPPYPVKPDQEMVYLFMGRLHFKKGIYPLVKAWNAVMRNANARLIICGSDEGELQKISPFLNGNIEYRNFISGEEKKQLLRTSHYIVLASSSEGLPTGVLEGMSYGLIPIISDGCNLPEVFENDLGFRVEADEQSIAQELVKIREVSFDLDRSKKAADFIRNNFSEQKTGERLLELYLRLM